MALSTMIMRPAAPQDSSEDSHAAAASPKAVVCFCHGYSDNLSYSKRMEYQRLARDGIAVVGIEYEGHGRSDGALCLIENWDRMIGDVAAFFQETVQQQFSNVPVFLMGESMGGAVAYAVYNRTPSLYSGVVFVCPMCKISDDMLPPQFVIDALKWIVGPTGSESSWIGHLPIAPSKSDLFETAHHVPEKAEQIYRCPTSYGRNPRLVTARELLHATSQISASLSAFDAPFLIVHGREDRVTDPQLSLSLYRESKSRDKSIRLYDGMWHGITSTEPDDNIDRVFRDCTGWILERCRCGPPSSEPDDDDDSSGGSDEPSQQQ
jgi:alpha-beta hydrolase superfamily lysophospholipase